jgi:hypothetical protein
MHRASLTKVCLLLGLIGAWPLPAASLPERLGAWSRSEEKSYAGQALYDYIDGGAEVYFEYSFSRVDMGYYSREASEVLIEIYTMASPLAALGIYSCFRDIRAPDLPEPYRGKYYEAHLECLNGSQYIKIVPYDSIGVQERFTLLRELVPQPAAVQPPEASLILPGRCLPGSEVFFNGPLALRNFCPLGGKNFFGVGTRTKAWGCHIEDEGQTYKSVTMSGDSAQLAQDLERFLAFQRSNDYTIHPTSIAVFLEDQLSGKHMALVNRGDHIHWIFEIENEKKAADLFENVFKFVK